MASIDELWLVDFGDPYPGEPSRHRPGLVVGPPAHFGARFPYVALVPLTTARRGFDLHVEVEPTAETGLDLTSYVQCELIRSVDSGRLIHRLGRVGIGVMSQVDDALRIFLGH